MKTDISYKNNDIQNFSLLHRFILHLRFSKPQLIVKKNWQFNLALEQK